MLGASPEVLFRISQDGMVTSEALAGSARIDDGANLVHDPKNVREHNLVVEDVCAQLSSLGPLQRESRSVSPLSGVAHLRTVVRCYPPAPPSFSDLVSLLHPTPALGIAPRAAQTLELLQRLDPLAERGRFGAPFGAILPDGEALCIVAIRNVQWQDGILRLGAGAGILKESSFEAEFEELSLKQRVVAELLFPHTGSAHLSKHSGRQHSSS